ncbi:MAG: transglutaminase-like domain-containing protein [Lachnospiraceae bacterium]|nr:transglutaminase-like domain-containing protein [Lachnospiraceae bacterium]
MRHFKLGTKLAAVAGAICLAAAPLSVTSYGMVRTPIASGSTTYGNDKVTVDASHSDQGYVMIKYKGGNSRIKVQITKGVTYTYDLNARDTYEVFPLTEGNGSYTIKVFENVSGNQYAQALSQSVQVNLASQYAPFLYPNQYVNFNQNSQAVAVSDQVAAGASAKLDVVTKIFNYVVDNLSYDYDKAAAVQSGYLPNVDATLNAKKGICFDYAALMTSMLRAQDIPTKLVVGYTGELYHAWISVYLENQGWVENVIYFDGANWSLMDPTCASSGGKAYGAGDSSYQAKYTY